jgi:hypothetical protein
MTNHRPTHSSEKPYTCRHNGGTTVLDHDGHENTSSSEELRDEG